MPPDEERLPPWRTRRPGSTGLLVLAFIAVFVLWLQVRPGPSVPGSTTVTRVPATPSAPSAPVLTPTATPGTRPSLPTVRP